MIIAKSKLNWVSDSNPTYCNFEADTSLLYYLFSLFCNRRSWYFLAMFEANLVKRGIPFKHEPLCAVGIFCIRYLQAWKVFLYLCCCFHFRRLLFLNLAVKFVLKKGSSFRGIISIIIIKMLNEFVLARKTKTARSKYQLKARQSRQNWVHLQKITDQRNKGLGSCFYLLYMHVTQN